MSGQDELFCRVDGDAMRDFYASALLAELNGSPGYTARVAIVPDEDGPWWCWRDASDGKVWFVWPDWRLLDMCFAYGVRAEEDRGRGASFRARAEILERLP